MDKSDKKKSASFGTPDKSATFGSWVDGCWPESGSAPRKTACFDDSGVRSRGQYTFGGVDLEKLRATIDADRKASTGGSGMMNVSPAKEVKEVNINHSDISFQERESTSQRNIYNVVKEEMDQLEKMPIFKELCDKSKYSNAKVCKITGQKGRFKNCPFCGENVHPDCLTRQRKDPQDAETYINICDTCNEAYLKKFLLTPYLKHCTKLLTASKSREEEYQRWGQLFTKIFTEVEDKKDVIYQKSSYTNQRVELYDKEKSDLNDQLREINYKVKELISHEKLLTEQIDFLELMNRDKEKILEKKRLEVITMEQESKSLDKEISTLKEAVALANLEMFKEREQLLRDKFMGGGTAIDPKKESIFSTNYAAKIVGEVARASARRGSDPPKENGNIKQTKPYCTLV